MRCFIVDLFFFLKKKRTRTLICYLEVMCLCESITAQIQEKYKLYELGFKSFATLKAYNSRVGRGLISQASDMVLICLHIKRRNKGGAFICKYPN